MFNMGLRSAPIRLSQRTGTGIRRVLPDYGEMPDVILSLYSVRPMQEHEGDSQCPQDKLPHQGPLSSALKAYQLVDSDMP